MLLLFTLDFYGSRLWVFWGVQFAPFICSVVSGSLLSLQPVSCVCVRACACVRQFRRVRVRAVRACVRTRVSCVRRACVCACVSAGVHCIRQFVK